MLHVFLCQGQCVCVWLLAVWSIIGCCVGFSMPALYLGPGATCYIKNLKHGIRSHLCSISPSFPCLTEGIAAMKMLEHRTSFTQILLKVLLLKKHTLHVVSWMNAEPYHNLSNSNFSMGILHS